MLASSITGEVEYSGWRHRPAEWSIVANIRPQSAGDRLAFRQHGHRRVIAMDALSRQHVILIIASRFGPARPRAIGWNGAGGWVIVSQARHTNFSRTVWITFL
jgi:hypothetical protein